MIEDALAQLSDSQAFTTNATTVTQRSYDLGNVTPKRKVGTGEPLALVFTIEAVTGAADTITLQAITTTAEDLTGSVKIVARTRILTAAEIPVGTKVVVPIPPGTPTQRFLGGSAILGAADALTASVAIVPLESVDMQENYASGFVILATV